MIHPDSAVADVCRRCGDMAYAGGFCFGCGVAVPTPKKMNPSYRSLTDYLRLTTHRTRHNIGYAMIYGEDE
jgi:hypothetical protein